MTDDFTAQAIQAIRDDATAPLKARIADLEAERDEARWTACWYRNAWWGQQEDAEIRLGLLPEWLTHDGADNAPDPKESEDNLAARQMGGERWHVIAAELRNLTARVESYERAEGNQT